MNRNPGVLAAALITRAEHNEDLAAKAEYWLRWVRHLGDMGRACERNSDTRSAMWFYAAAAEFVTYAKVRQWAADTEESTPYDVGILDDQERQS